MGEIAYVNGVFSDLSEATIPLEDRGLQFGDSLYEVVRIYAGRPFRMTPHIQRLRQGAGVIGIPIEGLEDLEAIAEEVLKRSEIGDGILYFQVTRGVSPRSHVLRDPSVKPTVIIYARSLPRGQAPNPSAAITHEDLRWPWCFIKSTTLLPNVMMQTKALKAGAHDCILHRAGMVTEGTRTNVFAVIDGVLRTAPLSNYILAGVTRRAVLELAGELAIPVEEWPISLDELTRAQEAFFCGTVGEITPVIEIDGRPVATGEPGPVTLQLLHALEELIRKETGQ